MSWLNMPFDFSSYFQKIIKPTFAIFLLFIYCTDNNIGRNNCVTRFGDFLDFGQLFKAFGNN